MEDETDAPRGRAIPTELAVKLWTQHNKTSIEPTIAKLDDTDSEDGSHIEYALWTGGDRDTAVGLYKVVGGGHGLPGSRQYMPVRMVGRMNQDVKGLELVWQFFDKHARRPLAGAP